MSRISVEISTKQAIEALDFKDKAVQKAVMEAMAEDWDFTEELDSAFVDRLTAVLAKQIKAVKKRSIDYGGNCRWNMEYAEKELTAGRKPDRAKFGRPG